MKRISVILSLLLIVSTGWAQCTITQPAIVDASYSGGAFHFSLTFRHQRNDGNKWVTIHMWKSSQYPHYDYDNPPTTTRLSGDRPFGTIVINNGNVDRSGTYTGSQAFVTAYQNDASFVLLNTSASTLVYNSRTDTYTLTGLQVALPSGTSVIKFDSWSSQSSGNQHVHCYCSGGALVVPVAMPVTGLETFKAQPHGTSVDFSWTTQSENNNSHFVLEEFVDTSWMDKAIVFSKYEDGNSTAPTTYSVSIKVAQPLVAGSFTLWGLLFLGALMMRRFVPARLTILVCFLIGGVVACKTSSVADSLQTSHLYRIKQVDKDQTTTAYSPTREVKL